MELLPTDGPSRLTAVQCSDHPVADLRLVRRQATQVERLSSGLRASRGIEAAQHEAARALIVFDELRCYAWRHAGDAMERLEIDDDTDALYDVLASVLWALALAKPDRSMNAHEILSDSAPCPVDHPRSVHTVSRTMVGGARRRGAGRPKARVASSRSGAGSSDDGPAPPGDEPEPPAPGGAQPDSPDDDDLGRAS